MNYLLQCPGNGLPDQVVGEDAAPGQVDLTRDDPGGYLQQAVVICHLGAGGQL